MQAERWQHIEKLFHSALERAPSERAAFLAGACAGDGGLRHEVESLLAEHERGGSWLETAAADLAADWLKEQAEHFIEAPALEVVAPALAQSPAQALLGRQLGHYQILSSLGAGGMGEVYRARDLKLDRSAAIKILPPTFATDMGRMRRFIREAKATAAHNHPNIATIYEIGESDGLTFIAMEYIEGQTLAARIKEGPLAIAEIVDIGLQIADALAEAHMKGITHRDIKPANIMITPEGRVKVLDFGLAKVTRPEGQTAASEISQSTKTEAGVVMGTVPYMSPEQALGREVDQRSDIFSLGVVLYKMVTGRLPFSGMNTPQTIDRILHTSPEAMARINHNVPPELEQSVRKCLEKDPQRRYQSARELLGDLGKLKRDGKVGGQRSEKQNTFLDPVWQRLRSASGVGMMISVLILAGAVSAYRIWNPGRPGAGTSVTPLGAGPSESSSSAAAQPARAEVMSYYLEMESAGGQAVRATGFEPLAVGETFKFHLIPSADGYLYMIAPEKNNALTTFLTGQPTPDSGVRTNRVEAGVDYSFPAGKDNWIKIGREGKLTTFTVIFSPHPLTTPGFLAAPAERALTAAEQQEFESLRRQFGASAPESAVETGRHQPSVTVTLPKGRAQSGPLLFDIPIQSR